MAYTVAVYLCDRAWGGAEEGGWYYDTGTPCDEYAEFTRGFVREAAARVYAEQLNTSHSAEWNRDRAQTSSVLSQGRYYAEVCEGLPTAYPSTRPYYS